MATDVKQDKYEELKAARDQARAEKKGKQEAGPREIEYDDQGIRFLQPRGRKALPLCGMHGSIMKYPLWANGVVKEADGTVRPKIVMCPISEQHSGGRLVEIWKRVKGFKEVSEIPDKYAEFRDPYLKAIAEWRQRMAEREALRKQLEDAGFAPRRRGITGLGSIKGLDNG